MTDTYAGIPVNPKSMTLTEWVKTKEGQKWSKRFAEDLIADVEQRSRQPSVLDLIPSKP